MDGILINHAALSSASQQMLSTAAQIDERLNVLEGDLARLRGGWTGSARESYGIAKQTWDTAISEVMALLREAGSMVELSNAEYRAADLRGAARFE